MHISNIAIRCQQYVHCTGINLSGEVRGGGRWLGRMPSTVLIVRRAQRAWQSARNLKPGQATNDDNYSDGYVTIMI